MTFQEAIRHAITRLSEQQENASFEAELLLAAAINNTRTFIKTWPEKLLTTNQKTHFEALLQRRSQGEPIAYILGQREFWDLSLTVTPDTLIPRPETEHLVELTLEKIPPEANWKITDMGTGSGAVALVLASQRPGCHVIATDISPAALAVAKQNANNLDISNIEFRLGDWGQCFETGERFQIIVSNPPYVAATDPHLSAGDLRFEPAQALSSGPLGLDDLTTIINSCATHLQKNGWLFLEHGFDQADAVKQQLEIRGFTQVKCYRDYAERERVSCGQWTGE